MSLGDCRSGTAAFVLRIEPRSGSRPKASIGYRKDGFVIDRNKVASAIEAELEDDLDGPEEYRLSVASAVADAAIGAVLEQLREPTEAMLAAGRPCMNYTLRSADSVWRVMLKAAEKETFLQP